MSADYRDVVLTAPVTFGYSRYSEHDVPWFAGQTLRTLIADTGVAKHEIDGLAIASFSLSPDTPPSLAEYFGLELRWLEALPFGGASGVIAARRAARAVQAGDAEIVACIAADTSRPGQFADLAANFSGATLDASFPYAAGGPNLPFALITQAYMERYGATREDFGRIAIAQRYNANHCPHALLREKTLTLDDYLAARPIVEPLHLFDCVMPCAGAEGFLVMSRARAESLSLRYASLVGAFESFNSYPEDPIQLRAGWTRYGDGLYEQARCRAADIDIVETYDDYPVIAMLQLEGMQLCATGEGAAFVRDQALTFDGGGIAHNTSGGQLSGGQAGAAGGFLGIVEAVRQLTRAADGHQVTDARRALVTGFGMVNYDRGLCSVAAILSAEQ